MPAASTEVTWKLAVPVYRACTIAVLPTPSGNGTLEVFRPSTAVRVPSAAPPTAVIGVCVVFKGTEVGVGNVVVFAAVEVGVCVVVGELPESFELEHAVATSAIAAAARSRLLRSAP